MKKSTLQAVNQTDPPVPHGRAGIVRVYGNPMRADGSLSGEWVEANITTITLPYPCRLAWDTDTVVTRISCHRLVAGDLKQIFTDILAYARALVKHRDGYTLSTDYYDAAALLLVSAQGLDLYGGCFNFRHKRAVSRLSTHSWGIAIDIDPERNGLGDTTPALPMWAVEIFKRYGWAWGGDFVGRKDPMHFQRATGY